MPFAPNGSGDVHVDKVLTNISIGWQNDSLVGNQLFPRVTVAKQSDKYYVFGHEEWVPELDDLRSPGTPANEIPPANVSTDAYYTADHSLMDVVTPEEESNADAPLNPRRKATNMVTSKIMLNREIRIRDLVTDPANYAAGLSINIGGTASDQWDAYRSGGTDTSDPAGVVNAAVEAVHDTSFVDINTVIIPWKVWRVLQRHPQFMERTKFTQSGTPNEAVIADLLGIPNPVIAGGGTATLPNGSTPNLQYIWKDSVILAYVPPNPSRETPAFGYEFVWPYQAGSQQVDRWYDNDRKAEMVRMSLNYDLKLTGKFQDSNEVVTGYLISDVLQEI